MTASTHPGFRHPAPLGVGCTVMPTHLAVIDDVRPLLDLVEVSPELLARELSGPTPERSRLQLDRDLVDPVVHAVGTLPVVVHGLGLSIGTAAGWDRDAVSLLDDFGRLVRYRWHSEHLDFVSAPDRAGVQRSAGLPLPLPHTAEAASLVAARADLLARRSGRPFLLENTRCHLPELPHDPGWDEATFLTEICRRSSCGLVLDLRSLLANGVDRGVDAGDLLERIPLERVVEVHVVGGPGPDRSLAPEPAEIPEQVWAMVDTLLGRAPNVAAVVLEIPDEWFPAVGLPAYRGQLERLRSAWDRHRDRRAEMWA